MLQASFSPVQKPAARWSQVAVVLVTLALSAYIDIVTGYEVSVFLLYAVPVALATRWLGKSAGLGMAALATLVWIWADKASGHNYSQAWFLYVNALNRMVCFLLTVAAIRYVTTQKGHQGELLARLQAFSGDVPLCQQCHRVSDEDGYWRPFDSYLTEFGQAHVLHKVCPDCARRAYACGAYRDQADQVA